MYAKAQAPSCECHAGAQPSEQQPNCTKTAETLIACMVSRYKSVYMPSCMRSAGYQMGLNYVTAYDYISVHTVSRAPFIQWKS